MRFCELFHSVHEIIQLYLIKLGLSMSVKDLQKSICMKQISVIWSIRNLILDTWWPIVFPLPYFPLPYFQCINSLLNFLGSWICCPNSEYVWSIIREFTTNQQAFYWSRQDSEEKVFRNKTHTEEKLHVTRPMCCQKIGYMLTIARLVINKVPDSLLTKYKQWYWWIIYYPMDHWSRDSPDVVQGLSHSNQQGSSVVPEFLTWI